MSRVIDLPFNKLLGLVVADDPAALLELPAGPQYLNHLGTVHAGALLSLADAASGEFLVRQFGPQSDVIAVVRRIESKFRQPANGRVVAKASADPKILTQVARILASKRRMRLPVTVELYDESGVHVLSAKVEWCLQKT